MNRPPELSIQEDAFADEKAFHEELIRIFGALVMWCRSEAVRTNDELLKSEPVRNALGTVFRELYNKGAESFDAEQIGIAAELNAQAIGHFGQLLMTLLAGTGMSLPVSAKHAARFRLVMELCDKESGEVLREEVINRGGKRFFADYWHRWVRLEREARGTGAG